MSVSSRTHATPSAVIPPGASPAGEAADSSTYTSLSATDYAVVLVEKLGRALHAYGSSAHRLENALDQVSRRLGLSGQFFSTPTAIFASFEPRSPSADVHPRTVLLRVEPGEVNLEKLSALDAVLGRVMRGELLPHRAVREVDEIVAAPPRFGLAMTFLAFAAASGGAARFFGGGPKECLVAAFIGLITGLLAWISEQLPNGSRLYETSAALVAALIACLAVSLWPPLSFSVITISALIVLVPGLTLTLAMTELASRNLISGSARFAGAMLMFMTIGVGFAVGNRLGIHLFGAPPEWSGTAQPLWTEIVALMITSGALLVLFRAHPRDYGWIFFGGAVALVGGRLGGAWMGPELGALIGAASVGVSSNLVARWRDRPAAITQTPGLMLLVPGSMGFRSVNALVAQDTLSGVQTGFTVALVAISLVTGLLLANVVVPPRTR